MVNHSLFQLNPLTPVSVFLLGKLRYSMPLKCQANYFQLNDYLYVVLPISWQIEREGKDVTITAFSKMVGYALQVCHYFVELRSTFDF